MTRFRRWRAKRRLKQQLYDEYIQQLRDMTVGVLVTADKLRLLDDLSLGQATRRLNDPRRSLVLRLRHEMAARREALLDSPTNVARNWEELKLPPEAFVEDEPDLT